MNGHPSRKQPDALLLPAANLDRLLAALRRRGYATVGPRLRDGAIVYDEIESAAELPVGWTDEQAPGHYRVARRDDTALFGYAVGPHSWKKYLFPPRELLWRAQRDGDGFRDQTPAVEAPRSAFIGVRACELHAIAIQDRVFTGGASVDPRYAARRDAVFLVAVNCAAPADTCFCTSMNTGPRAESGYDLALTELLDTQRHDFLVEIGSAAGADIAAELNAARAGDDDARQASQISDATAAAMGRTMDTREIKSLLYTKAESPRWNETAERCVSCGNCTSVCPTCFCSDVEDLTSLDGQSTDRVRQWGSCFTQSFTHMAGGSSRVSTASRYRHWLTHKLAGWQDQFGTSGCVGCGRCISWCPPGIDLTEEIAALRAEDVPEPKS